jgi:hypothetical protein
MDIILCFERRIVRYPSDPWPTPSADRQCACKLMNTSVKRSWRPRRADLLPPLVFAQSKLRSITVESKVAGASPTEPLHRSTTISTLQNDHGHEGQRYTAVHGHEETGPHDENVLSGSGMDSGMDSGTKNEPSSHDVSDRDICVTRMSSAHELSTVDVVGDRSGGWRPSGQGGHRPQQLRRFNQRHRNLPAGPPEVRAPTRRLRRNDRTAASRRRHPGDGQRDVRV